MTPVGALPVAVEPVVEAPDVLVTPDVPSGSYSLMGKPVSAAHAPTATTRPEVRANVCSESG